LKQTLVILILAVLFGAWLLYSSQRAGRVVCESCIEFGGKVACAKAAAETKEEALRQAATVACAQLASGMTDGIVCQNTKPESTRCDGAEADAGSAPAKRY